MTCRYSDTTWTDVLYTSVLKTPGKVEDAARFLTDHLRGDVYYRTAFPGQNLQRARAQLALLCSMLDQEDDSRGAVDRRAGTR